MFDNDVETLVHNKHLELHLGRHDRLGRQHHRIHPGRQLQGRPGARRVAVSFDMATGRDEDKLSGGFGYFGTTEVSGAVWFDADFDGVNEVGATATDGDYAI